MIMNNKTKILIACFTLAALLSSASCDKIIEKRENTSESDTVAVEMTDVTESEAESESEEIPAFVIPEYINPLTGLETTEELACKRPVAVMINNIRDAMPQEGTSYADVIYECIVEGAQTRLMAVYHDYESAPVIGSVRSSREYFIDLAYNHDAIYVHAGGSNDAYKRIKSTGINNLDGVNMYLPDSFYRDSERRKTMSLEHTLMTSGERITSGISFKGYRDEIKEGFTQPFNFCDFESEIVPADQSAKYVAVSYSAEHSPYYIYNEENALYERYQFNSAQSDNSTGDQLKFDNIIILYCSTYNTGDKYGHYSVNVTGEGKGVYITRGGKVDITWKKADTKTPASYYLDDGSELIINRGRTMMQICTTAMESTTVIAEAKE